MSHPQTRRELWSDLADLFLDTETRWYLPRLAASALRSGYPWSTIEEIYQREVAPVVAHNLLDVAGDWCAFPEPWLFAQIEGRRPGRTLLSRLVTSMLRDQWIAVRHIYNYLQGTNPSERVLTQSILQSLAAFLLEKRWSKSISLYRHLETLAPQSWTCLQAHYKVLEPIYRPLLVHPADPKPAENAASWSWFQHFHDWVWAQSLPPELVIHICSELQYLYLCQEMPPQHPCLPRLLHVLHESGLEQHAAGWLTGPLGELYNQPLRARRNWDTCVLPRLPIRISDVPP